MNTTEKDVLEEILANETLLHQQETGKQAVDSKESGNTWNPTAHMENKLDRILPNFTVIQKTYILWPLLLTVFKSFFFIYEAEINFL